MAGSFRSQVAAAAEQAARQTDTRTLQRRLFSTRQPKPPVVADPPRRARRNHWCRRVAGHMLVGQVGRTRILIRGCPGTCKCSGLLCDSYVWCLMWTCSRVTRGLTGRSLYDGFSGFTLIPGSAYSDEGRLMVRLTFLAYARWLWAWVTPRQQLDECGCWNCAGIY